MLNKLIEIVAEAGLSMKNFYDSDTTSIKYKGEIDLVTEYDVALEKQLTAALNKAFPDFRVIGEESSPADIGMQPGKVIYIDPIDGTTSFVHRYPFACISVGVFVDEKPFCGVVNSPMLNEVYTAEKGKGAFLNGKKIKVSTVDKPIHSLFATGFAYERDLRQKSLPLFYKILDISQGMRRTGSAALDLCYVARGTFDMYYESQLKPWDMAAGILFVQEAGGKVTDLEGNPHDLSSRTLLASNGIVHEEYMREINSLVID